MQAACEAGGVLALLEGGAEGARGAAEQLGALYAGVREPWLTRSLLAYHARTGSTRALELLARAPEPHARHLLDALHEQLRGERGARRHALAALAPLVARRPAWLRLLPAHPLARDLLRAARSERDAPPLLHALLALAALVPAVPALAAAHAPDLAEALVRAGAGAGAGAGTCAGASEAHVALAARALFRAVYATHPCTAVEALRGAGAELAAGSARDAWERAVAALASGVRLHPALVTSSRARESEAARWARVEPHDVLAECRRLSLPARDSPAPDLPETAPAPSPAPAPLLWRHSPAPPPGSTAQATMGVGALRPGGEGWWALGERSGAEAAPHTPLPADAGADVEPEPAVEATPENTPRLAFRFPAEGGGGAARAIGRRASSPPAPPPAGGAASARLARVAAERRAADSPVPFGGAPPAAAARPEPRAPAPSPPTPAPAPAPAPADPEPEDSEVRELTARAAPGAPSDWADTEPAAERAPDPRAAAPPRPRRTRTAPAPPPRRAASAGPVAAARRADAAAQTVDTWPEPYEFLLADFYRTPPDEHNDQSTESSEPCERLDAYLAELYAGRAGAGAGQGQGELAEQLALAHAQLMYERWRREAHAERNRRLLGRCRQVRALELHNAALQERVRALTRERDALRTRASPAPAPSVPAPAPDAAERALDGALQAERAARLRADAARHEAEEARARDQAELQRTRGETFEAARHVEALARAALAAERRAEHVRRLRRELLVLAEREARLTAACEAGAGAGAATPAPGDGAERALRAAVARAETEAAAAGARADAAVLRAGELEATLAARDAAVVELKRATRHAAEEGAARTRALRDKYAALLCVVRAREARDLERLAGLPTPAHAHVHALAHNCG